MNNLLRKILFACAWVISVSLSAQEAVTTYSADSSRVTVDANLNIEELLNEDIKNDRRGMPTRLAINYPLNLNMENAGKWQTLEDGSGMWTLTINAPNTSGAILVFDDFYIPDNAKLNIYSDDNERYTVYTKEVNREGGAYQVDIQTGSEFTLEYLASDKVKEKPRLSLIHLGYKYRNINSNLISEETRLRVFNDSRNSCIPNINCPIGDSWQIVKKGVVYIQSTINGKIYGCSGMLVNNTSQDKTPYVLSATHCFRQLDNQGVEHFAVPNSLSFSFEYEQPGCDNLTEMPPMKTMVGAKYLVLSPLQGGSDGALVQINRGIDPSWDVYYGGWDISDVGSNHVSGAVIHHPANDTKKISLYSTPLVSSTWANNDGVAADNAHWKVNYSEGVTQGGSSGSPLFNQDGFIVGTLTGGSSECGKNGADMYGKLAYHWDKSSNPQMRMKPYLDPYDTRDLRMSGAERNALPLSPPEDNQDSELTLYWNKNTRKIEVNTSKYFTSVQIYDLTGSEMHVEKNLRTTEHSVPVLLSSGVHVVTVSWLDGSKNTSKKILIN